MFVRTTSNDERDKLEALLILQTNFTDVTINACWRLSVVMACCVFTGCAAQQTALTSPLMVDAVDDGAYVLRSAVTVRVKKAKDVDLKAGTRWRRIGSIGQGDVLTTRDQVVMVNSFDVHEADIVVREQQLVGFYLRVEKTFVAAKPVAVEISKEEITGEDSF